MRCGWFFVSYYLGLYQLLTPVLLILNVTVTTTTTTNPRALSHIHLLVSNMSRPCMSGCHLSVRWVPYRRVCCKS